MERLLPTATNEKDSSGEPQGVAVSAPSSEEVEPGAGAARLPAEIERAVGALYDRQHAFVWRNARRLGCDDDWVDDAVHEIFLVAARRLPELREVRLIALTGYGRQEDREAALEAGCDMHLVKPVEFSTLERVIAYHVAG